MTALAAEASAEVADARALVVGIPPELLLACPAAEAPLEAAEAPDLAALAPLEAAEAPTLDALPVSKKIIRYMQFSLQDDLRTLGSRDNGRGAGRGGSCRKRMSVSRCLQSNLVSHRPKTHRLRSRRSEKLQKSPMRLRTRRKPRNW